MRTAILTMMMVLPAVALAQPGPGPGGGHGPRMGPGMGPGMGQRPTPEQMKERMAERMKRHRLEMSLRISEALELNEAETIKLNETLSRQDARHQQLMQQRIEARRTIQAAARKDPEALKKVDEAIKKLQEARVAAVQMHKEVYDSLAQGLSPEKKAKLVLTLGEGPGGHGGKMGMGPRKVKIERKIMHGGEEHHDEDD